MHLEAKSVVEIDEQVWGKVELDLTQRPFDANLLSNFAFALIKLNFPLSSSSLTRVSKLNFPSHMLGNSHCRFASKRFCVKSSSTFPQICSGILTVDFDSLKHAKKSLYRAPTAVFCKDWSRSLWRGHSSINQSQM